MSEKNSSYWLKHFVESQASGLSAREYCDRNSLSLGAFYYWRKKLKKLSLPAKVSRPFVQVLPKERLGVLSHLMVTTF